MTVGELLKTMTSAEITYWLALFNVQAEERQKEERKANLRNRMG